MIIKRILLIINLYVLSVCCFAQAADKLFLEGQKLQQVMTIASQQKAINKFKSAKAVYKSQDKKAMCDNQVVICERNIRDIKPTSKTEPTPNQTPISKSKKQDVPAQSTSKEQLSNVTNMQYNGGLYTGSVQNGKPHGRGTFVFGTKSIISAYDINQSIAEAGESIEGRFENGVFYRGIYHSVLGDKKINFGSKGE